MHSSSILFWGVAKTNRDERCYDCRGIIVPKKIFFYDFLWLFKGLKNKTIYYRTDDDWHIKKKKKKGLVALYCFLFIYLSNKQINYRKGSIFVEKEKKGQRRLKKKKKKLFAYIEWWFTYYRRITYPVKHDNKTSKKEKKLGSMRLPNLLIYTFHTDDLVFAVDRYF